jgi:hypothetical protein
MAGAPITTGSLGPKSEIDFMQTIVFRPFRLKKQFRDQESMSHSRH